MPVRDPVFIIGAPRSGTSLLYYLLAGSRGFAYPDVTTRRVLHSRLMLAAERLGLDVVANSVLHRLFHPQPGRPTLEPELAFLGLDREPPVEGAFMWSSVGLGVAPESYRPEHLRDLPQAAELIRRRYAGLLRRTRRDRVLDKAPAFTAYLDAMQEVFHDATVVHIIRDGRAVVNSIAYRFKFRSKGSWDPGSVWWGPPPRNAADLTGHGVVERASHQWTDLVQRGRAAERLFPGRYIEVRYENITTAARSSVLDLLARLGISPVDNPEYPERLTNRNAKWQAPSGSDFGDAFWTNHPSIDPDEYEDLEVMRPLLEELGYVAEGEPLASS